MAHSFDTKAQIVGTVDAGQLYLSAAYTCGAGATLLVLGIVVAGATARAGGAPTYNGNAMARADNVRIAAETNCELWFLLAPPTGSALSISIPNTGSKSLFACASSYKAQSGYQSVLDVEMGFGGTGTVTDPSVTLTPTVNGDVIVGVLGDGYVTPPSGRTHTTLYETDDGAYSDSHQYGLIADTSETVMGWTVTGDDRSIVCAAFREVLDDTLLATIQPSTADGYIRASTATTNYGTTATVIVSPYSTNIREAIVSFDFAASVPAGATIAAATLSLYDAAGSTGGRTITCYRLRRTDWVEAQATWNIFKTDNNWGTAGALNTSTDHDTTDGAVSTSVEDLWQTWNVTDQVQYARDSVGGIAHFLLLDTGASAAIANNYNAREYSTDTRLCPKLSIEYTEAAAAGPVLLQTVNGLAKASVKTRNGLAIASVKTWNGLA